MTNKNNPKVTIVIGNVRITKIGFTIALSKANTTATIIAEVNVTSPTPGRKYDKIKTATAVNNKRRIKLMV